MSASSSHKGFLKKIWMRYIHIRICIYLFLMQQIPVSPSPSLGSHTARPGGVDMLSGLYFLAVRPLVPLWDSVSPAVKWASEHYWWTMLSAPCCHYYSIKSSSAHSLLLWVNLSPIDLLLCFYDIRMKIGKSVCFRESFLLNFLGEMKFTKHKIICPKVRNSVAFSVLTMSRAHVSTTPLWPGQHRNLWGCAQPPRVLLYIHPASETLFRQRGL